MIETGSTMTNVEMLAAYKYSRGDIVWSDNRLSREFIVLHGERLRWVPAWGWLEWAGSRWICRDDTYIRELARDMCARIIEMASGKLTIREEKDLGSKSPASAVETMSRGDPRIICEPEIWDAAPLLRGTPNGTLDLAAGEVRAAKPDDYITKYLAVTPDFNIPCPVWDAFLKKITAKHPELIEYFQRLLGYALSGTAEEETFEFFFGPGGNGKGTLLTTMLGIMGDYAMTLGMEALLSSYGERHSTEVADLAGKLVVVAQETDEGRSWNEGRIKNLTGRDRIRARFVKKDSFEFQTC